MEGDLVKRLMWSGLQAGLAALSAIAVQFGVSLADLIAAKPPGSLSATKKLMRDAARLVAQMNSEGAKFEELLSSAEAREAISAFTEKRKPDFSKLAKR